jgi:hypothetical protein
MVRTGSLAAIGLLALSACGDAAPRAAEPASQISERPGGTVVFVSRGNRLTAIDVATGRRRVRRVSALAACGPEVQVTAGHVVFAGLRKGRTTVYSMPLALDRSPVRLGTAHVFVPSATTGRVWLAGTDCHRRTMVGVREVTVDGRVTVDSPRRVPGTWVAAAVPGGLVILRGRTVALWDPRSGRTPRRLRLAAVTKARGDLMLGCTGNCHNLAVSDAATGRTVVAHSPDGQLDIGGALSPDGSLLAAPVLRHRRWRVALVNTRTGATSTLKGSRTGRTYPQPAWSASSGWLLIRGGRSRILAYRPGSARVLRLPVKLPASTGSFAAG